MEARHSHGAGFVTKTGHNLQMRGFLLSLVFASSAAASVTVQSLREQLVRQSYAFVRARDMWSLLGVAADTAPSLLALWASM